MTQTVLKTTDEPHYSFFQALYLAFYAGRFYVDVVKRWRGWGVAYLLFLISVIAIPFAARFAVDFNAYFQTQLLDPMSQLPPFLVQNGQVIFDKSMPYFVKDRRHHVRAILDTTGTITTLNATYPNATILITKDAFVFKPPVFPLFFSTDKPESHAAYTQKFTPDMNEMLHTKDWVQYSGIRWVQYGTLLLIYPALFAVMAVVHIGLCMMMALLGRFWAHIIFKCPLSYREAMRLMAAAFTAPACLMLVILLWDHPFDGVGLVFNTAVAIYFSFGVSAVRRARKQMVHF